MPAEQTQPNRAERRALAKAQRRAPRKLRRTAPRDDVRLAAQPWKIAAVWEPLEALMRRMEMDGTIEHAEGRPVAEDHSTGVWYEIAPAVEGLADFHEIAAARRNLAIDVKPLRQFASKLVSASPVIARDIAAVRACAVACKRLARSMTTEQAESVLQTVRVGIALESAG